MIRFEHVNKRYPERGEALHDINLLIETGEMVIVTGHSGAGKTTLLRLIGLFDRPSRGRVFVNGVDLGALPAPRIPEHRRQVGMIFQDHRLLPGRSVFDNVALPLIAAGLGRRELGRKVRAALDQVGLLRHERILPSALSSGEQQRVGIARAIVGRPPVLLADEPTGNLDPDLSREIFALFQRFEDHGVTLLIATHQLDIARQLPHRMIRLHEGRVMADSGGW